ncbi:MAG: hypothetical protein JRI25_08435 [Deltaproteobacteria bacterium]|nr:hypothetical protein [Deltaproteobacteria bacterium]MBW2254609.1 hypothetical protein [Deltaproteobacteria bacterium]
MSAYLAAGAHYFAVPPLWDDTGATEFARLPQIIRIEGGSCTTVATFSEEDARRMSTGFGGGLPGEPDVSMAAGFVFEMVEVGSELWVFSNTRRGFWRVDTATGAINHDDVLDRFAAGVASDGNGGAWVSTAAYFDTEMGNRTLPPELWHLDASGSPVGAPRTLPFDDQLIGFGGGDSEVAVAAFVFHPLVVGPNGDVWVLDSRTGVVAKVVGGHTTHQLDMVHPSGMAPWNDGVLIATGLDATEDLQTYHQVPTLHWVDLGNGAAEEVAPLPEPTNGWGSLGGFVGPLPNSTGVVPFNVWFPISSAGEKVIVASPSQGTVLLLDSSADSGDTGGA